MLLLLLKFWLCHNLSRRRTIGIGHLAANLLIVGILARFASGVFWRQHTCCFTHLVSGHERHDSLSRLIGHDWMNLINHAGICCDCHGLACRPFINRDTRVVRAEGLRERAMSRCHGRHLLGAACQVTLSNLLHGLLECSLRLA